MVKLTIDGQKIEVKEELTLLEIAQQLNIEIPTLCYHEALSPYGACRLCIVEIITDEKRELKSSCSYPVQEGLVVETSSARVIQTRKMIVELLLASCPNSKKIQDLAKQMGITKPRFETEDNECILCGLCVRVCAELMKISAVDFFNRGPKTEVTTPFQKSSDVCVGCGACASVCPIEGIKIEDIGESRTIHNWHTVVKLKKCKICGNYFAPVVQLDSLKGKTCIADDFLDICQNCRRKTSEHNIINAKKVTVY